MAELYLRNKTIASLFELLGENENDITYSVGWTLSRSPAFLAAFLRETAGFRGKVGGVVVRLQEYRKRKGITDIELEVAGRLHVIIEAKRGWNLPKSSQLRKYASRFRQSRASVKRFVVLSECSQEHTEHNLDYSEIRRIPVKPFPWSEVAALADDAKSNGTHAEKHVLHELRVYLERIMTMQNLESNMVYVVAIRSGTNRGWKISAIDIVEKRRRYFHPAGISGWPKEPPNYIGFRYGGKLRSIHHVEGYEVVTDLHKVCPEIPSGLWVPMFAYRLGHAIRPLKEVKTGRIFRAGRVWCMLDTLLTSKTISEARDLTKKRLGKVRSG